MPHDSRAQKMGLLPTPGLGRHRGGNNAVQALMALLMGSQQTAGDYGTSRRARGGPSIMSTLGAAGAGLAQQQPGQNLWSALSQGLEKGVAARTSAARESREAGRFKLEQEKAEREAEQDKQAQALAQMLFPSLYGQGGPQSPQIAWNTGTQGAPPIPTVQRRAMGPLSVSSPIDGGAPSPGEKSLVGGMGVGPSPGGMAGGLGSAGQMTPPPEAIADLKSQPWLAEQFNAFYGPGMAQRILGFRM